MQTKPGIEAFFLPAAQGQRFCVLHSPPKGQALVGSIVYIHPFAEEMNRSRRMASLQARAFATAGFAVLILDQQGCGDSSSDFEAATWEAWLDDVVLAARWMADRAQGPLWLWGVRTGCLLAAQAASRFGDGLLPNFLMWQPVLSGQQYLRQFLRLKLASALAHDDRRETTDALAGKLASGESVEVAGYLLSPVLARGLELASLDNTQPKGAVVCFELLSSADDGLSPALQALVDRWRGQGVAVSAKGVTGGSFWQSVETLDCPALVQASLEAVLEVSG